MAFAAEHPLIPNSEHRVVSEVERTPGEFQVVSEYEPAGDQPAAIAELNERLNRDERELYSWVLPVQVSPPQLRG